MTIGSPTLQLGVAHGAISKLEHSDDARGSTLCQDGRAVGSGSPLSPLSVDGRVALAGRVVGPLRSLESSPIVRECMRRSRGLVRRKGGGGDDAEDQGQHCGKMGDAI